MQPTDLTRSSRPVPQAPGFGVLAPLRDRLRIMVVDDMSTSRGMLLQGLDALGCRRVFAARDARAALTAIRMNPVDLVLADYIMPDLDGLDLLEQIRKAPLLAGTGFVLITGSTDPIIGERGRRLGINGVLAKPYSLRELRSVLETAIGRL